MRANCIEMIFLGKTGYKIKCDFKTALPHYYKSILLGNLGIVYPLAQSILKTCDGDCENLRRGFVSSFFVLGCVLGHFCNVLLYIPAVRKQNIAEMS